MLFATTLNHLTARMIMVWPKNSSKLVSIRMSDYVNFPNSIENWHITAASLIPGKLKGRNNYNFPLIKEGERARWEAVNVKCHSESHWQ